MPFTDMTSSKTYAVHKQKERGILWWSSSSTFTKDYNADSLPHREESEREQIIYVLTLPGTATTVNSHVSNQTWNYWNWWRKKNYFFNHIVFKTEINNLENRKIFPPSPLRKTPRPKHNLEHVEQNGISWGQFQKLNFCSELSKSCSCNKTMWKLTLNMHF